MSERAVTVAVTVVWGEPQRQVERVVQVADGSSLRDAVRASGLVEELGLALDALDLGVFNRPRPADSVAREGDRIEIYRPLTVDPKEARRVRAEVRRRRAAVGSSGGVGGAPARSRARAKD